MVEGNTLGKYLKDRRTKLDPQALGLPTTRRRTAGLRREEVAMRANMSTTWYTWLEQGRGGAPSAAVLDRLSEALLLTPAEREHMYLLALGRSPDVQYKRGDGISPRLQGVLDGFAHSPAFVSTARWDIVGWNKAATAVLADYSKIEPEQRNILKLLFLEQNRQSHFVSWEKVARSLVAIFRGEMVRSGATDAVQSLVDELCEKSAEFRDYWKDNEVMQLGEATKQLMHPEAGMITMELSSFMVDGRPDLKMLVYSPATDEDVAKIKKLMG